MLVGVASGEALLGVFALKDSPKPNAAKVVHQLRRQGLKTFLLTGDHARTAKAVASQVGIAAEHIFAEVRPEQKADFVKQLQSRGERVAFVGDGINDAPALTAATVGIAFGQASDVTAEAAGAVVLDNALERVDELFHIGRRMRRIALQSAVGGMALSVAGMLVAAAGYLPPVAGAVTQEVIDVFAVLNALRAAWAPPVLRDY